MTAEVAVLNKSAVALAADSAVTVGDEASGKIWNSVNKVFTLSKYHPVGIMIYSNADYMGVPFETIIKSYREALGRKSEGRIEDYAAKLVKYLSSQSFASDFQQGANARRIWQAIFDEMNDHARTFIEEEFRLNGDCSPSRHKEILNQVANTYVEILESEPLATGFEKKKPAKILNQYSKAYERARDAALGRAPNKGLEASWKKIAGLAITKKHRYSIFSGVVVAGFGEDEMFPNYVVTQMSGIVSGVQKSEVTDKDGITHEGSHSFIVPFAQTEMVHRFMQGVDRAYDNYVRGSMIQAMEELAKGIVDVHTVGTAEDKAKTVEEIRKSIGGKAKEWDAHARDWRRKKFVDEILDVVVSLPKEELANLAEALVNLTSIKRRVSLERETVGGPIDVAVISKGDGFIWIKRKHYFTPELNPNFAANYFRGVVKEKTDG